jgi:hypothetical protein
LSGELSGEKRVREDADENVSPSLEGLRSERAGGGGEVVVEEEENAFLSLSSNISTSCTFISVFISLLSIIILLSFSISFSLSTPTSSSLIFSFFILFPFFFSPLILIFSSTVLSDICVVKKVEVKDVAVDENIIVPSTTPSSNTSINGTLVRNMGTGRRTGAGVGAFITGVGLGYTVECTVELIVELTVEFTVEFTVELGVNTLGYVEVGDDNNVEGDFNECNDVLLRGEKDPFLSNPLANSLFVTAGKYNGGKISLTITIFCSFFCTD